jgi:hypothetical protein
MSRNGNLGLQGAAARIDRGDQQTAALDAAIKAEQARKWALKERAQLAGWNLMQLVGEQAKDDFIDGLPAAVGLAEIAAACEAEIERIIAERAVPHPVIGRVWFHATEQEERESFLDARDLGTFARGG